MDLDSTRDSIKGSGLSERMKRALLLVADGGTPTDAAELVGYSDPRHVRRYAARFGLRQAFRAKTAAMVERRRAQTTAELLEDLRHLAASALLELSRRIDHEPGTVSTRDLVVAAGVATDKIARRERWGVGDDQEGFNVARADALAALAMAMQGKEVRVSVRDLQDGQPEPVVEG